MIFIIQSGSELGRALSVALSCSNGAGLLLDWGAAKDGPWHHGMMAVGSDCHLTVSLTDCCFLSSKEVDGCRFLGTVAKKSRNVAGLNLSCGSA